MNAQIRDVVGKRVGDAAIADHILTQTDEGGLRVLMSSPLMLGLIAKTLADSTAKAKTRTKKWVFGGFGFFTEQKQAKKNGAALERLKKRFLCVPKRGGGLQWHRGGAAFFFWRSV